MLFLLKFPCSLSLPSSALFRLGSPRHLCYSGRCPSPCTPHGQVLADSAVLDCDANAQESRLSRQQQLLVLPHCPGLSALLHRPSCLINLPEVFPQQRGRAWFPRGLTLGHALRVKSCTVHVTDSCVLNPEELPGGRLVPPLLWSPGFLSSGLHAQGLW